MDDGRIGASSEKRGSRVSVQIVAERIREARSSRRSLRITGAGTWLAAGRPVNAVDTLSLGDDRGIVEYVPGDLTLTTRAGTPLADIEKATASERQWLPLDPWGGDGGTLGATLSTATSGPHSHAMGLPRDVVLGVEFVSGSGQIVRAGGRVVKNVAGFDLTRLMVGSWGTLGVITEATVRLRARPELTRTIAIAVSDSHVALTELAVKLRALPFTPLASELLNADFARRLKLGEGVTLLARAAGNERSVAAQLETLRRLGESSEVEESVWNALRSSESADDATWRWSKLPSAFGETWGAADRAVRALNGTLMHGNPARGIVRMIGPRSAKLSAAELTRVIRSFPGTVVLETLPKHAWQLVDDGLADDAVSRAIRQTFNPGGVLNPGILGSDS